MQSLPLFLFFILAFASSFHSAFKLTPRCTDQSNTKQVLRGKVSIEEVSMTFAEATQSVVNSFKNGVDTVTLKQEVVVVKLYASQLTSYIETLDGRQAITHSTTVIEVFASYIAMINAISDSKNGGQTCHSELVEINAAFRQITSRYLAIGIDLQEEFKKQGKRPQFNPDKFNALKLESPFAEELKDQVE